MILTHFQGVPERIMQFRNFDVPLMCFVSGVLVSKKDEGSNTSEYYKKATATGFTHLGFFVYIIVWQFSLIIWQIWLQI